jgi:hypothetical protein
VSYVVNLLGDNCRCGTLQKFGFDTFCAIFKLY